MRQARLAILVALGALGPDPRPGGGLADQTRDPLPQVPIRLAARYPCDQGIAGDPAVVFAENFEEGSVPEVTARYDDFKNPPGMALVADVPAQSCGAASMQLTAGGPVSATDLYKLLPGNDELYVRWYVKYQAGIPWHHTGVWFGGYNPPLPYPNPQAGTRPNGDDRVSFAIEPVWGIGAPHPRLDFYNYWMKMHTCSGCGGFYWGNALVSRESFTADDEQWMCIEVHARLNPDPTSGAGAVLEVWKNDAPVQRFSEQRGSGYWVQDHFCPATADGRQCTDYAPPPGTPMVPLDLQTRTTTALQLNHFWPQSYITNPAVGKVWLDDMVLARVRIGCIR